MPDISRAVRAGAAAFILGLPVVGVHSAGLAAADSAHAETSPAESDSAAKPQRAQQAPRRHTAASSSPRPAQAIPQPFDPPAARRLGAPTQPSQYKPSRGVEPQGLVAGATASPPDTSLRAGRLEPAVPVTSASATISPGSEPAPPPRLGADPSGWSGSTPPAPPAAAAAPIAALAVTSATPAGAPDRISSVAVITRAVNAAANWISDLPASPFSGFLQGALLLVRRTLFPTIALMPKCATTSAKNCAGVNLDGANLAELDLTGVNFAHASMVSADLHNANLTAAVLDHANLSNDVDLSGARLIGASLRDTDMSGGVVLTGADLTGADLTGAILLPINGGYANFTDANLTNANLSEARLGGAVLVRARLANATLTDADLTDADLTGANLTGATLTGVRWQNTTCPNGSKTDTGCSSGAGNATQGVGNYQFHWEATWIRTWYDPAHFESYTYNGALPQNPTFDWSKAGSDYTASFVQDRSSAAHFRIHVNTNSWGSMGFTFVLPSPMRISALTSSFLDGLSISSYGGPNDDTLNVDFFPRVGDRLDPGTYVFQTGWLGLFGIRQSRDFILDLEPTA